jgi:hypothetical protein
LHTLHWLQNLESLKALLPICQYELVKLVKSYNEFLETPNIEARKWQL